jgi:hypothetical protein
MTSWLPPGLGGRSGFDKRRAIEVELAIMILRTAWTPGDQGVGADRVRPILATVMRWFRRHLAVSWVLILAQAACAIAGPAGLVVCHEPNGMSHVELPGESCCGSVVDSSTFAVDENCADERSEDPCPADDCDDQQVGQDPARASSRLDTGFDLGVCGLAPALLDLSWDSRQIFRPEGAPSTVTGPPRQATRALRSTILIR